MKIVYVALGFPPDVGGSELYNREIALGLHERGHSVHVFTWSRDPVRARRDVRDLPFEVHWAPQRREGGGLVAEGLAPALEQWAPDVIFVARASRALTGTVALAASHAPVVLCFHEVLEKHCNRGAVGRWRVRRRYGLDRARHVVASSQHTRERLLGLGLPEERVHIVHPGADTKLFGPDLEAGERLRTRLGLGRRPMLLTVARLAANKGHDQVIDALPALRARIPELLYVIVGSGPLRAPLEARVRSLGLEQAVVFAGEVPDVRPFLQACDAFVMMSTREGFGIAYVEAGACGKPVVASASGGGAEIVVDGETGHVVPLEDGRQLETSLHDLLANPERARALGEQGRRRVQRYDWANGAAALEGILARTSGAD